MTDYTEILYEAYHAEFGLWVQTNDPQRLRLKLYAEREKIGDPCLKELSFTFSPINPDHLWIVKRKEGMNGRPPQTHP